MTAERPTCPKCGGGAGGSTCLTGDSEPSEGDFAICAYCGAVNVYRADRRLRPATDKEVEQLRAMAARLRASPLGGFCGV